MRTNGRTDKQADMTQLIVAFCNFAKAPKNQALNSVKGKKSLLVLRSLKKPRNVLRGQNLELMNLIPDVHKLVARL